MSNHTPGPWQTQTAVDDDGTRCIEVCFFTPAGEQVPICHMSSHAVAEHDARLMAAAPLLLAACKSMLVDLEDQLADTDSRGSRQTLQGSISYLKRIVVEAEGSGQ